MIDFMGPISRSTKKMFLFLSRLDKPDNTYIHTWKNDHAILNGAI